MVLFKETNILRGYGVQKRKTSSLIVQFCGTFWDDASQSVCWGPEDSCAKVVIPLVLREGRQGGLAGSQGWSTLQWASSSIYSVNWASIIFPVKAGLWKRLGGTWLRLLTWRVIRPALNNLIICFWSCRSFLGVLLFCFLPVNCHIPLLWLLLPSWWPLLVVF